MQSQHLKPQLIVMLTHHDQTVSNALELFEHTKEYPIAHWGFKDVGLSPDEMQSGGDSHEEGRENDLPGGGQSFRGRGIARRTPGRGVRL